MTERRYYPVHWVEMTPKDKRTSRGPVYYSVCGRTRRPWKISRGGLGVLVIRDILVSDDRCEEYERCLDLSCDLNRTTVDTFSRSLGYKNPPKWLREKGLLPILVDAETDEYFQRLCREHQDHGVISVRNRSGRTAG